jgi:hypothetical protein
VSATETPWPYIHALLGPGLHWSKSSASVQAAIDRAERDGQWAAAEHLRIILDLRNRVAFDGAEKNPPG